VAYRRRLIGRRQQGARVTDGRRRQWVGATAVAVGIAGAAVIVPPLITPDHDKPDAAPSPPLRSAQPIASAFQPAVSASPSFAAISVQAEDPANTITGGASAVACATCRGGRRVRYLCAECTLVVRAALPVAGSRTVTVYYEAEGNRSLKVRINGGAPRTFPVTGPDWSTPRPLRFTADLPAGEVRLTLYNDESPAPDLDEIVIA
jgi:hypothetical protein